MSRSGGRRYWSDKRQTTDDKPDLNGVLNITMMNPETRDLIDRMADAAILELQMERRFRDLLVGTDEATRTEIAFYLADALEMHPRPPADVKVSLSRVEKYMACALRIANWHMKADDLLAEMEILDRAFGDSHFLDEGDLDGRI